MAEPVAFGYRAINAEGQELAGQVQATSKEDAASQLLLLGIKDFLEGPKRNYLPPAVAAQCTPQELTEDALTKLANEQSKKQIVATPIEKFDESKIEEDDGKKINLWTSQERIIYLRRLGAMLQAGCKFQTATNPESIMQPDRPAYHLLEGIHQDLKTGHSVTASFRNSGLWPRRHLAIIKAGETGGCLDQKLTDLAEDEEASQNFKHNLMARLTQPGLILIGVAFGVPLLLQQAGGICGHFSELAPHLQNQPSIQVLQWFAKPWMPAFLWLGGFSMLFLGYRYWRKKPATVNRRLKVLPFFRSLAQNYERALVARNLATLIQAGVNWKVALQLVSGLGMYEECQHALETIGETSTLAESFPPSSWGQLLSSMLKIGQDTGKAPEMLNKAAALLEEEAQYRLDVLLNLIEPVLLASVGLLVGAICLLSLLPLVQVISTL